MARMRPGKRVRVGPSRREVAGTVSSGFSDNPANRRRNSNGQLKNRMRWPEEGGAAGVP